MENNETVYVVNFTVHPMSLFDFYQFFLKCLEQLKYVLLTN